MNRLLAPSLSLRPPLIRNRANRRNVAHRRVRQGNFKKSPVRLHEHLIGGANPLPSVRYTVPLTTQTQMRTTFFPFLSRLANTYPHGDDLLLPCHHMSHPKSVSHPHAKSYTLLPELPNPPTGCPNLASANQLHRRTRRGSS